MQKLNRGSGVLLHITSLPCRFGVGDLGKGAVDFVDFLSAAGQQYWQILPTCPVSRGFDCSPYMGLSAFAGNPQFIDPDQLVEWGLLPRSALTGLPEFSEYMADFDRVVPMKLGLLRKAFQSFKEGAPADFDDFCSQEKWLHDYALFMALRSQFNLAAWFSWPKPLVLREESVLLEWTEKLAEEMLFHKFLQYCFSRQWKRLRSFAHKRGISIIGDIPFYVSLDSSDVWAEQQCFKLDSRSRKPTHIAGVPPDYFSETGQRWGNPLFRWHAKDPAVKQALYAWWRRRFRRTFDMVDIVRVDHFRGFEACWEIAAAEKTAINGVWVKGPGIDFFREMQKEIGDLPIIAEDLGVITPEVEKLRDDLKFPGMKVLQFAFDSDENNPYLPHNYQTANCVVYTGTHDNDTSLGWYMGNKSSPASRQRAMRCANSSEGRPVHWDFIRMAFASVAALAIVPLQDILGFGSDCRMNTPGTRKGNWSWRVAQRFLSGEVAARLADETGFYNRLAPRKE